MILGVEVQEKSCSFSTPLREGGCHHHLTGVSYKSYASVAGLPNTENTFYMKQAVANFCPNTFCKIYDFIVQCRYASVRGFHGWFQDKYPYNYVLKIVKKNKCIPFPVKWEWGAF